MPAAARLGDIGIHCGSYSIATGSPNVLINGIPAARVGDVSTPHVGPGCKVTHVSSVVTGSPNVLVNGRPLAHVGSTMLACTVVMTGSPNVRVNL